MIFSAKTLKNINLKIREAQINLNDCKVKASFHNPHYEEDLCFRSGLSTDKGEILIIFSAKSLKNTLKIREAENNLNKHHQLIKKIFNIQLNKKFRHV